VVDSVAEVLPKLAERHVVLDEEREPDEAALRRL